VQTELKEDVYIYLPACFDSVTGIERSEVILKLKKIVVDWWKLLSTGTTS
jgi:hypothetical protein